MAAHALLSPSSASRWLACTRSARLEEQAPDKAGEAAAEGTLAHSLGELLIALKEKQISKAAYTKKLKEIQADKLYEPSMMEYAEDYASFVIERFNAAKAHTSDAKLFIETKVDLSAYVPEGFGTADAAVVADGVLDFIDLKYGKGVEVSAKENKQMMLYALGLLEEFDWQYDISTVRMTIFQPRLNNISPWEIPAGELKAWGLKTLKPKAELAFNGEGEFVVGDHCRFCRVRATCRAHHDEQMKITVYDFGAPALLEDHEVADVLTRIDSLKSWLTEVSDHALHEAVVNSKKWPGFKLVEGRSNRVYTDKEKVTSSLVQAGFSSVDIHEPLTLLGVTKMEKLVGKKKLPEIIGDYLAKPPGKPTLAPADDPRAELNSVTRAQEDFADEYIETEPA